MQTNVVKRAQGNLAFACKACQKTRFPVAMEIETNPNPISNHNGRVGF